MWFDTWSDVLRIILVGACAYALLVVILLVSGKRTLSKLNAFDFVITIALGSTLATILMDSATSLVDGVVALGLLVALQMLVATATSRVPALRKLVTAAPTVILLHGEPLVEAMRRQRVGLDELRQAVRANGSGDFASLAAVVLETDGTMSVISRSTAGDLSVVPDQG